MASHLNCPECEQPFGFSPALVGKTIRCRQCQFTFTVNAPPRVTTPPPVAPVNNPLPTPPVPEPENLPSVVAEPPPLPAKVVEDRDEVRRTRRREANDRRHEDYDYDRPHSSPRRSQDEEDRPRSRARQNRYADVDDFHDDEPPRSQRTTRKEPGSGALLGVILGCVLVLLLGGGLIAYVAWPSGQSSTTTPSVASNTPIDPTMNLRPAIPKPPMPVQPPVNLDDLINQGPKNNPIPPIERPPITKKQPPIEPSEPSLRGLSERKEIVLNGAAEVVIGAASGKLLCVLQPTARKLVVIDVAQGNVVKSIDVDARAKIAAGRQYLYVLDPMAGAMERWDLAKLERDERSKFVNANDVQTMAMGVDSEGPLVVVMPDRKTPHLTSQLRYLNGKTYEDMNYRVEGQGNPHGLGLANRPIMLAVSANGKDITASTKDWPLGPQIERIHDGVVKRSWQHIPAEPMRPCNDGQHLCSVGVLYDYNLKPVGKKQGDFFNPTWFIPAVDGNGYLALSKSQDRKQARNGKLPMRLEIRQTGSEQLLLDVGLVPDLTQDTIGAGRQGFSGHVLYFHSQKALAVISADKLNSVVIYRVKLNW